MMSESELQRIIDRAGLTSAPADLHPLAYRDRHGCAHLPLEATVELARAFAAAEPAMVIGYLDDQEAEMQLRGNVPGERWRHSYLREKAPGFAIARQWAGLEQEAEMLRKEIARPRSLVSRAAYDLEHAGAQARHSVCFAPSKGGNQADECGHYYTSGRAHGVLDRLWPDRRRLPYHGSPCDSSSP